MDTNNTPDRRANCRRKTSKYASASAGPASPIPTFPADNRAIKAIKLASGPARLILAHFQRVTPSGAKMTQPLKRRAKLNLGLLTTSLWTKQNSRRPTRIDAGLRPSITPTAQCASSCTSRALNAANGNTISQTRVTSRYRLQVLWPDSVAPRSGTDLGNVRPTQWGIKARYDELGKTRAGVLQINRAKLSTAEKNKRFSWLSVHDLADRLKLR